MEQTLAVAVNENQDDSEFHLTHVEFAFNRSVSAATGWGLNEVHIVHSTSPWEFRQARRRGQQTGRVPLTQAGVQREDTMEVAGAGRGRWTGGGVVSRRDSRGVTPRR